MTGVNRRPGSAAPSSAKFKPDGGGILANMFQQELGAHYRVFATNIHLTNETIRQGMRHIEFHSPGMDSFSMNYIAMTSCWDWWNRTIMLRELPGSGQILGYLK